MPAKKGFRRAGFAQIALLVLLIMGKFAVAPVLAAEMKSNDYDRMIIFGDSYSDNGNVYRVTAGAVPNKNRYYQGRFSNGPAWCEYFAQHFNIDPNDFDHFVDFAYGGAKILSPVKHTIKGNSVKVYLIPNLSQQIDFYLNQYGRFNHKDLIVVFMGTNDMPLIHIYSKSFFQKMADQESQQIDRLIQNGGENIIVFNIRNLSYLPLAQLMQRKRIFPFNYLVKYYLPYLLRSIQTFNQRLNSDLKPKPQIFIYNIFDFDTSIFSQIKKGGFIYLFGNNQYDLKQDSIPCYANYTSDYQNIVGTVCQDPTEYFFYDRVHTTTVVNYLLAADVYRQFSNSSR